MSSDKNFNPIAPGVTIGHVHLKVAGLERAVGFYCGLLGFEITQRYGTQAAFVSSGGLGHLGVKLAKAFGAHVVVFTHSSNKVKDALPLGADEVVYSRNEDEMKKHLNSFHFILDAVAAQHTTQRRFCAEPT